jgi:SAM-dependent methyltransferase
VGFSTEWEDVYRQGCQNSVWPWSDLVSYVMRYSRSEQEGYRVLELGFGAGANIPFLLSIGADYYGTEGSLTAVEKVRARFRGEDKLHLACCDFTKIIPFDGPFDLIVDRSSLTHNDLDSIRDCLRRLRSLMGPRAKFIGIDWFSTANAAFQSGAQLADYYTRGGFTNGQFKDIGVVHFSDERHLRELLTSVGFVIERLEHKRADVVVPQHIGRMAWWNFVAVKS